ncbi:MAG: hypothetical protein ONB12_12085 [candidate division KSB1 bacterium]|nr:hypothetical protein [candidate division KSB1 bacterium]
MSPTKRIAAGVLLAALVIAAVAALSVICRAARIIDAAILFIAGFAAGVSLSSLLRKK